MLKMLYATVAASAVTLAVSGLLAGANALPLARAGGGGFAVGGAAVELVHGCHRGVQRDYGGWHFHNRACLRVDTAPPGYYDRPSYRRSYRGPVCSHQCRFIGPVKTCEQVCR